MIPQTITDAHVRQAAAEIRANGVPIGREADKFLVLVDGKPYPPKLTLSIAAKFATGTELSAADFSGGDEANHFLEKLQFQVVPKRQDWSREECLLAVWAYDEMDLHRDLVKKRLYEEVAALIGRTPKAVEFKLQNVSACDPRPRSEKPINEAANKQQLLKYVFEEYWLDRAGARITANTLKSSLIPKQSPWDRAIQRIRSNKSPNTYMPTAVIAALELVQELAVTPGAIPFNKFEERFDALQSSIGEGAVGMAWEPFLHLAATANVWTLFKGSEAVQYQRQGRPKSRAQLLNMVDRAAFLDELKSGAGEPPWPTPSNR